MRKTAIISLLLLIMLSHLTIGTKTAQAQPSMIRVPQDYSTIQEAIDVAQPFDTILVSSGVYYENIVIQNKSIRLVGENKDTTFIIGPANGTVEVKATNNLLIKSFTVINNASAATVFFPIRLRYSNNSRIEDCSLIAVSLYSGVWLEYSHNNTIKGNIVRNNGYYGVYLFESCNNTVIDNTVASRNGILFSTYCEHNTVTGNMILTNNRTALYLYACSNNIFYHNSFVNMTRPVFNVNSTNAYNNSFSEGNYWSSYNDAYNLTTGIGLKPYIIDVGNQDNYPLRNPYIPGDYNHDGTVDVIDLELAKNAWQTKKTQPNYNPHVDFNMDGIINIKDIAIIGINWQKHT